MNKDYEDFIKANITKKYEEIGTLNNKTHLNVFQNFANAAKLTQFDETILKVSQGLSIVESALGTTNISNTLLYITTFYSLLTIYP